MTDAVGERWGGVIWPLGFPHGHFATPNIVGPGLLQVAWQPASVGLNVGSNLMKRERGCEVEVTGGIHVHDMIRTFAAGEVEEGLGARVLGARARKSTLAI